jgi:hypothetical protein
VIDRSEARNTPDEPVAVCAGRPIVWNSRRGNHLGQRLCATAYTGRTNDRKRSDQNTAQQSCEARAVHILMLTLSEAIPKAHALATAGFSTISPAAFEAIWDRVVQATAKLVLEPIFPTRVLPETDTRRG